MICIALQMAHLFQRLLDVYLLQKQILSYSSIESPQVIVNLCFIPLVLSMSPLATSLSFEVVSSIRESDLHA
jgi:hypothetical protein